MYVQPKLPRFDASLPHDGPLCSAVPLASPTESTQYCKSSSCLPSTYHSAYPHHEIKEVVIEGVEALVDQRLQLYAHPWSSYQRLHFNNVMAKHIPETHCRTGEASAQGSALFATPVRLPHDSRLGRIFDNTNLLNRIEDLAEATTRDYMEAKHHQDHVQRTIKQVIHIATEALHQGDAPQLPSRH